MSLRLYQALDSASFLRSYLWKLYLTAVLVGQLPVSIAVVWLAGWRPLAIESGALRILVLCVLIDAVALLLCLHQLFRPVQLASDALHTYLATGRVIPIPTRFRDEVGILLRMVDRTLRSFQRERASLEVQATEDPLTGLPNRRGAMKRMNAPCALSSDESIATLALLDLDHFKRINDEFGHPGGDAALVRVSQFLAQSLRRDDWVCRWGGEEFLLVIRGPADHAEVLERLRDGLQQLECAIDGRVFRLTVSVGFTRLLQGQDPADAIRRADEALYEAKRSGRNRIVGFEVANSKPVSRSA